MDNNYYNKKEPFLEGSIFDNLIGTTKESLDIAELEKPKAFLDLNGVLDYFPFSKTIFKRWIKEGKIKPIKVDVGKGTKNYYETKDIFSLLRRSKLK